MGEHFARGRSAEIFRTEDGKILKLFFPDYPREYAEKEYKNTKIAASLGCTGMQVYDMVERGGRFGFVMDCIDGVSQNDMPGKKPAYLFQAGKDLARCHVRVQKAHTRELDDVREVCLGILGEDCMAFLTPEEKSRAAGYLRSLPDDDTVLHLDFHTGNVLVDKSGECKIIDWMTAARGNRAVEEALMEFFFSEAELFPEASKAKIALFSAIRGSIGKSFFKEYQKLSPLSAEEIDRYRLAALILRRHWNIAFEEAYLTKTIRALIEKYGAEEKETIE